MHWRDLFTSTRRQVAHHYLVFKHFLQKGPCNSTQFKNSWCQSKPFRWLMCRNDARIFLLRVLSTKRVRSCNWLTEAQSTNNCGVCQVSFYVFREIGGREYGDINLIKFRSSHLLPIFYLLFFILPRGDIRKLSIDLEESCNY
jgi:hypothetical protein